jgi:hypothetical protein
VDGIETPSWVSLTCDLAVDREALEHAGELAHVESNSVALSPTAGSVTFSARATGRSAVGGPVSSTLTPSVSIVLARVDVIRTPASGTMSSR